MGDRTTEERDKKFITDLKRVSGCYMLLLRVVLRVWYLEPLRKSHCGDVNSGSPLSNDNRVHEKLQTAIFPALSREQGSGVAQLSHSHHSTRQFVLFQVTQHQLYL